MAKIQCTVAYSGNWEVYVEYAYTQSNSGNYTTFNHGFKLRNVTGRSLVTGNPVTVSYIVNGNEYSNTLNIANTEKGAVTLLCKGTTRINHDAQGKGTAKISVPAQVIWAEDPAGGGEGPGAFSLKETSVTLATIPRQSTPTYSGKLQMGETITILTNRASTSFTHNVKYSFGSLKDVLIASGITDSHPWTIPDLASNCNNATSGELTITLDTYNGGSFVGSKSITGTLSVPNPTIPTFPNGVYFGRDNEVVLNSGSSNFRHELYYSMLGDLGVPMALPWNLSLLEYLPRLTDNPTTAEVACYTYNGSALVGVTYTEVKVYAEENADTKPTIEIIGITDDWQPFGAFVQGFSIANVEFSASSAYAPITKIKLDISGQVTELNTNDTSYMGYILSDVISSSGSVTLRITATNSANFSAYEERVLDIVPYAKPTVKPAPTNSFVILARCNEDGAVVDDGGYMYVSAMPSYSRVEVDGIQQNSCSLSVRYKSASSSVWSDYKPLIDNWQEGDYTGSTGIEIDTSKAYNVELVARDSFGNSHTYSSMISVATADMHFRKGGHGISVGEYYDEDYDTNKFQVAWETLFKGNMRALGESFFEGDMRALGYLYATQIENEDTGEFVDFCETGESGAWYYRKWASGILEYWSTYEFKPTANGENRISIAYPFTFNRNPCVQIIPSANGSLCSYAHNHAANGNNPNATTTCNITVYGVTNTNYYITLNIHAIGRWK